MTTIQDVIDEASRHLHSNTRIESNVLAAGVDAVATTLSFTNPLGGLSVGSTVAVGLELMVVLTVDVAAKTCTVRRAANGSVGVAHLSGAYATVNPRFSDFDLFKAVQHEVASLSTPLSGLYQMQHHDFVYSNANQTYNFAPGVAVIAPYRLVWRPLSGNRPAWRDLKRFRLERGLDGLTDFPGGYGLMLSEVPGSNCQMRLFFKAGFVVPTAATQTLVSLGLPDSVADIIALGAAARLVLPREVKRNFTEAQGEPRRAEEVAVGAQVASARALMNLRAQRLSEEVSRLSSQYPLMGR